MKTLSAPISIQLELTPHCNHRCVQCYNYWRGDSPEPINDASAMITRCRDVAAEIIRSKVFQLTFTGGEPLIVIKRFAPAIAMMRDAGIELSMNSNLSLMTPELANFTKELGIKGILTSILASDPLVHDKLVGDIGSHERVKRGIEAAVKSGIRVAANMVVMKQNQNLIRETAKFAQSLGVKTFCATKASAPQGCSDFSDYRINATELARLFEELLWVKDALGMKVDSLEHYPACSFETEAARAEFGGRNCSAAKTGCTIGYDLAVRPCSHAHDTYGHLLDGLDKAWQAMDTWRQGGHVPDHCQNCSDFPLRCGGGCRVEGETAHGTLKGADPFCQFQPPKVAPKRVALPTIQLDEGFALSEKIRIREEPFGITLYRSARDWLCVEPNLFKILQSGQSVSAISLGTAYAVAPEVALKTLQVLKKKGLITAIRKEVRTCSGPGENQNLRAQ